MKLAFLLFVALAAPPLPTAAQDVEPDASGDSPRERARQLNEQGREAFNQHDYARALGAWREAYYLAGVEQLRYNIAVCLERLARFREAALEYEAAASSTELSDDERERARQSLETVRQKLGVLAITGSARTAFIDDSIHCEVPCEVLLDPGEHQVVIDDGAPRSVQLRRGATERIEVGAAVDTRPPTVEPPTSAGYEPSALFWGGLVGAVVGAGATVGFGLQTLAVRDDFDATPNDDLADEGETWRLLTNVAIGVVIVGGVLLLVDLIFEPLSD